jgi:hypothetical protein
MSDGKLPCPHCGERFTHLKTWRKHVRAKCRKAEATRAAMGPDNAADVEARSIEAGVLTGAPLVWPDVNAGYGALRRIHVQLSVSGQDWWILPAGDFVVVEQDDEVGTVGTTRTALLVIDWRNQYLYLTRRASHEDLGRAVATIIDRMTARVMAPVPAVRIIDAGQTLVCGVCGRRYKAGRSIWLAKHLEDAHDFDRLQMQAALREADGVLDRWQEKQAAHEKVRGQR